MDRTMFDEREKTAQTQWARISATDAAAGTGSGPAGRNVGTSLLPSSSSPSRALLNASSKRWLSVLSSFVRDQEARLNCASEATDADANNDTEAGMGDTGDAAGSDGRGEKSAGGDAGAEGDAQGEGQDEATKAAVVKEIHCDNCAELGHTIEDCPHVDSSEAEEEDEEDEEEDEEDEEDEGDSDDERDY